MKSADMAKNMTKIKDLLYSTKRSGIAELFEEMVAGGFFTAPCSTQYHLAEEGGLAQHSLNVYRHLKLIVDAFGLEDEIGYDSIILCALLHDLGKMGDHRKNNYVPNLVRSKKKNPETGDYDLVVSEAKPYKSNSDLTYEEHEIRSVIIAERFIWLSEDEETAILHHNGLYSKLDSAMGNANYCKTKLAFMLHSADMYCSRFAEGDKSCSLEN